MLALLLGTLLAVTAAIVLGVQITDRPVAIGAFVGVIVGIMVGVAGAFRWGRWG